MRGYSYSENSFASRIPVIGTSPSNVSLLNSPAAMYHGDNLRVEEERIKGFRSALKGCQGLTDGVLGVVESFETCLDRLESTMLPLHKQTRSLTRAQKHIDLSIEQVSRIHNAVQVANTSEDDISKLGSQKEYQLFYEKMEKIHDALTFFEDYSSFQSSGKAIRALSAVQKKAVKLCLDDFLKEVSANFTPFVFENMTVEIKDTDVVSDEIMNRLGKLAKALSVCGNETFVDIFIESRSSVIESALLKRREAMAQEENELMLAKGKKKINDFVMQRKRLKQPLKYEKGSHPFISFFNQFLRVLQVEREIMTRLLDFTSIDDSEVDVLFSKFVEKPLDEFVSQASEYWKKRQKRNIIEFLDILSCCEGSISSFREIISNQCHHVISMFESLRVALRKGLIDKIDSIHQHSSRECPEDGGYAAITVQSMNFLKNLQEYAVTIESSANFDHNAPMSTSQSSGWLNPSDVFSTKSSSADLDESDGGSALEKIAIRVLNALRHNLDQKAKTYRNSSLMFIFLLNNYHYVIQNIKTSMLVQVVGSATVRRFEKRAQDARLKYKKVSWDKALLLINPTECKEILKEISGPEVPPGIRKKIKSKFSVSCCLLIFLYIGV